MNLPEDKVDGLRTVLKDCLARITQRDGGLPAGAAFFVSDTLLVTNRHVVGEHAGEGPHEVRVHMQGTEAPVRGTVRPHSATDPGLDVALVEVAPDPRRPAVVLHHTILDGGFLVAGYPREDFYTDAGPGAEVIHAEGHTSDEIGTGKPKLLRLTGVQIKPGLSGGPVLSTRTGAVVAVTVYTEDERSALGGGTLPMWRVLEAYPEVKALAAEPPPAATQRLRELLERPLWEALGLVWDPEQQVDIYLSGDRSRWRIGIRPDDAGSERTVRDLGDDMGEVLVRWARSSGRRDESEVRLLGRLLSAAVFPQLVADRLPPPTGPGRDPVLVRLHVDGPLADLPWEFTTDPADPERFLAATDGYAFVRVSGDAPVRAPRVRPRPQREPVTVLGVVVQPDETVRWPSVMDTRLPRAWPTSIELLSQLEAAVTAPKTAEGDDVFRFEKLVNPPLSQLVNRAQQGAPVDVVHYIGFAYREPPDRHALSGASELDRSMLACSAVPGSDDIRHHRASEVVKAITALGPGLVVLEFGSPPLDEKLAHGCEPIGPPLLAAAAPLGVDALVCTRPVHPMQYGRFNAGLYSRLAAGKTVEQAVQLARQDLLMDQPVDFAGFGWFMATTGNTPRPRFFEPPAWPTHR